MGNILSVFAKKPKKYVYGNKKNTLAKSVRRVRDASALAFDCSCSMRFAAALRLGFSNITLRSIGVFLLTFGGYSLAVALLKMYFSGADTAADIAASGAFLLLSLPLTVSSLTLRGSLLASSTGQTLLSYLGIRTDAYKERAPFGRLNAAFIFGVLLGTLTVAVPVADVMLCAVMAVAVALIFSYPEISVIMAAALAPFADGVWFLWLALAGVASFAVKFLRGKRRLRLACYDKTVLVMIVCLTLGAVFALGGVGSAAYIPMAMVYFVVSNSLGGAGYANRVLSVMVASTGAAAAVLSVFVICTAQLEGVSFADAAHLVDIFDENTLACFSVALIPTGVSLLLSGGGLSRRTAFLAVAAMIAYLSVCGMYYCIAAALVGTVAAIMFYNRRAAYLLFAFGAAALVLWMWLGGTRAKVMSLVLSIYGRPDGEGLASEYFLFGEGLVEGFGHGGSFYMALLSRLGVIGLILIMTIVVLLGAAIAILAGKCKTAGRTDYKKACVPMCALIALALLALRMNLWEAHSTYLAFWIFTGAASAYLADAEDKVQRALGADRDVKGRNSASITI